MSGDPNVSLQALEARARERLGTTLGDKWRLDRLLGVGGMAAVFAATHRNGSKVAVKLMHPQLAGYQEIKQRFLAEAYAANKVGHPGVVHVLDDAIAEDGCPFLVMELLEGDTLESRVRKSGPLSAEQALDLADQLLAILAAGHDHGVIHRDVKPDNVFLTREGEVKVLDFGIATAVEGSRPRTTRQGTFMGTPSFMPPEQARGKWDQVDARSDIFGVGATLYHAVSGRYVREGETEADELFQAMTEPAPPVEKVAPLAPQIVCAIIDRALAFAREDRFANARAMQAAVREARGLLTAPVAQHPTWPAERAALLSEPDTLSQPPVSHTTPPTPRWTFTSRRRRWVVGGAASALGVLLLLMVFATGNSSPDADARASGAPARVPLATDQGPSHFGEPTSVEPVALPLESLPLAPPESSEGPRGRARGTKRPAGTRPSATGPGGTPPAPPAEEQDFDPFAKRK